MEKTENKKSLFMTLTITVLFMAFFAEVLRFAFWLMNKESTIAVYTGFLLVFILVLAAVRLMSAQIKAIVQTLKQQKETDENP